MISKKIVERCLFGALSVFIVVGLMAACANNTENIHNSEIVTCYVNGLKVVYGYPDKTMKNNSVLNDFGTRIYGANGNLIIKYSPGVECSQTLRRLN